MKWKWLATVALLAGLLPSRAAEPANQPTKPDVVVAADGSGNFTNLQAALSSIPRDNHERMIVFINCHHEGGDYAWHKDNLASAPAAPQSEQITAAWTFAGKWDPERASGPTIRKIALNNERLVVTFSENVTVKGRPRLMLRLGGFADYVSGSGGETLVFNGSAATHDAAADIDLHGGAIIATEAAATLRAADLSIP